MQALFDCAPATLVQFQSLREASAKLVSSIGPPAETGRVLPAGTDLLALALSESKLIVLDEGTVMWRFGPVVPWLLEEGDLIGIERGVNPPVSSVSGEFAVRVSTYPTYRPPEGPGEFAATWAEYLTVHATVMSHLIGELASKVFSAPEAQPPQAVHLAPGEVLVSQGERSDDVYTLVEGALDVMYDGVKVGEVQRDEIFGAIAALAGAPRSASVVAAERSLVFRLPAGGFLQLMQSKPTTVFHLVKDMARALVDANEKVVGLTKRGR